MQSHRIRIHLIRLISVMLVMAACVPTATAPTVISPTLTVPPPTLTSTLAPTLTLAPTDTVTPKPTPNTCKLPEAAYHRDVGLGFPRYALRMAATGTINARVIFVDFPDAPASETPEHVFARISPGAPDFFKAVSYQRFNLVLDPYLVWLRMSKPSTEYQFERGLSFDLHRAYIKEAVALADPQVDFSDVQAIYVMANPSAKEISYGPAFAAADASYGISVDGNGIKNGATSGYDIRDWGYLWLNHEAGHTLGLVDLYAFQYDPNNYDDVHRFVGGFSVMGFITGKAPEPLAYERWLVGWLDDDQVICQQTSAENITISAIEKDGGVKAVMIPIGITKAVIVESRRALGYDSKLPKGGALVYSIDTAIATGEGPIKIFPIIANDPYRYQSPLAVGESVTVGNVTITVTAATADGDTVQITVQK